MEKGPISVRLSPELLEALDRVRGRESRGSYVRAVLEGEESPLGVTTVREKKEKKTQVPQEVRGGLAVRYRCPVEGCGSVALSSAARCSQHPGKFVVEG